MSLFRFLLLFLLPMLAAAQPVRWSQTPGPYSSHIYSLAHSGSTLYASAWQGVVYRSNDYGRTWLRGDSILQNVYQNRIMADGGMILMTTSSGVYRSLDSGRSWSRASSGLKGQDVRGLVRMGEMIFISTTSGGVHRTTNDGESWEQIKTGLKSLDTRAMGLVGSTLVVATGDGLYRSLDSGRSWKPTGVNLGGVPNAFTSSGDTLWVATAHANPSLYRSLDSGATWTKMGDIPDHPAVVSVLAHHGRIYIASEYNGVRRSTDGGASWERVDYDTWVNGASLIAIGDTVFAGTSRGLLVSNEDGSNWTQRNFGLNQMAINALAVMGTTLFSGGNYDGLYRSRDGGMTWEEVNEGLAYTSLWFVVPIGDTLWAGAERGLFRSTDEGDHWEEIDGEFFQSSARAITRYRGALFLATGDGLYRSSDGGATWIRIYLPNYNDDPRAFVIVGDTLLLGSSRGVWRTFDGENWEQMTEPSTNINAISLAVSGSTVFAGTWNGVYRSTDRGESWIRTDSVLLGGKPVYSLLATNGWVIAGTQNDGIFISSNHGDTWTPANDGLRYRFARALVAMGETIYAGLLPGGIYRSELAALAVSAKVNGAGIATRVVPNPVDNAASIRCRLERGGIVTARLVDLLGREVAAHGMGWHPVGEHTFVLPTDAFADGLYLCRLQCDDDEWTIPIIVRH